MTAPRRLISARSLSAHVALVAVLWVVEPASLAAQPVFNREPSPRQPFIDLQDSKEVLHDLRIRNPEALQKNADTEIKGETKDCYPLASPAVYRDPQPPKEGDTVVERGYDDQMRNAGIGAGAANATTRQTIAKRQRILLNAADRTGRDIVDWAGEVGGSGRTFESAQGLYPRYTKLPLANTVQQIKEAAAYRGQPLSSFMREPTQPIAAPALPPAPLPARTAAPVIYDGAPPPRVAQSTEAAPAPAVMPSFKPASGSEERKPATNYSFNKGAKTESSDNFPQMPN